MQNSLWLTQIKCKKFHFSYESYININISNYIFKSILYDANKE